MATALLFGPEWMRTKQTGPATARAAPSPPLPNNNNLTNGSSAAATSPLPGASTYSSLVAPHPPLAQAKQDVTFKYSKDQMLAVWKEGGGGGPLPIDVERWEGIVREDAIDPATSREMSETERKLFAAPLNSEMRRRQSTDHGGPGERPKLSSLRSSQGGGSLADGMGLLGRRRRGDSTGTDVSPQPLPRKSSWTVAPASPGLGTPRSARPGANGFEGVLSAAEGAWGLGKRRTSTNQVNSNPQRSDSESDATSDAMIIKEEPETIDLSNGEFKDGPLAPDSTVMPLASSKSILSDVNEATIKLEDVSLNASDYGFGPGSAKALNNEMPMNPPATKLINPLVMQWIYEDPMGNIQGPFPAETMQTWHDQQYFTDDLKMKRVDVDRDWITVADVKVRALGDRIFLSQLADVTPPPGLSRIGIGLPRSGIFRDIGQLDSPRQPTPHAFGTPHSHFAGSSSPASSFGNPVFNGISSSPDSYAVGSRLINHGLMGNDVNGNGRISSGAFSSPVTNLLQQGQVHDFGGPRNMGNDMHRSNSAPFENNLNPLSNIPWQTPAPATAWDAQLNSSLNHSQQHFGTPGRFNGPATAGPILDVFTTQQRNQSQDPFSSLPTHNLNTAASTANPEFNNGLNTFTPTALQPLQMPIRTPSLSQARSDSLASSSPITSAPGASLAVGQGAVRPSAWGNVAAPPEARVSPFDVERPRASNTFVSKPAAIGHNPAWGKEEVAQSPALAQNIPWTTGNPNSDNWGQLSEEPQSLTTANVLKHEEQHKASESLAVDDITEVNNAVETPADAVMELPVPAPAPTKQQEEVPQPVKRKQSLKPLASPQAAKVESPRVVQTKQPAVVTPTTSQTKSPWGMTEDSTVKTAASVGLREIQEAEKKKQEARRQAELEKERAARSAVATSGQHEEVKISTSWGLPISHMGTRAATAPAAKEGSAATQPVWSNAVQTAATKKTMKEIQEEEERRRALAAKETIATAAKKSAAAAAASKIVPAAPSPSSVPIGGAWSVVGTGGKVVNGVSTPATAATRTNTVSTASAATATGTSSTSSTPGTPTRAAVAAPVTPNRTAASSQVTKPAPVTAKVVEEAQAPSPEFLKWLRDSLRELNGSVQAEEIAQMLLSFPLDPDPSTVELITELIHGASTTLHGRRFASDFVAKRKEDAARPKIAVASSAKPASLAEVVRTQPKPTPEFSAFKVVKKKGKRS